MLLYHYCSNDTFLSILRNSELWLSELTLSNDSMEGIWVREVLLEECRERNLSPHALDDFAKKTTFLLEVFSAAGFCLSAEGDLLSQWRGYAENGAGVAIGFDRKSLKALCDDTKEEGIGASLNRVIYDRRTQRRAIRPHADKLADFVKKGAISAQSIAADLLGAYTDEDKAMRKRLSFSYDFQFLFMMNMLFKFKNSAFSEEREWRILSLMNKAITGSAPGSGFYSNPQDLDFRSRGDHIVPYVRLQIPGGQKHCIKEIILGPRNRTPEPVVRSALKKYGFHYVDVRRSAATYR